ncbi:MAG: hypothetical protein ACJAR5_000853, partial [Pseudophaeobacter arcticus]
MKAGSPAPYAIDLCLTARIYHPGLGPAPRYRA